MTAKITRKETQRMEFRGLTLDKLREFVQSLEHMPDESKVTVKEGKSIPGDYGIRGWEPDVIEVVG